ncbi:MAG: hypothetical protein Q8R97_02645 [Brevundimonas sp.]|uniref:hypothetical protein n=1 Tax=Brevundimonas sp. TaxID=1871086 RepID=UPI00277B2204|nr:hypothetical protein [Brevundimonas sp.]MDP3400001.1 hypothetical protein [Brevundimonas sp.]MDZ4108471.1 hypothetical protein [Brevundimonas sp.]
MDDRDLALAALGARVALLERQVEALAAQHLPDERHWRGGPSIRSDRKPGRGIFRTSPACRQSQFETAWFSYWCEQLGAYPGYHRKLWELVFICQALHERKLLRPGSRGLGFGVGREPLSACFAARGCHITATDQAADEAVDTGWADSGQHALGKAALMRPDLCPPDVFDRSVEFRAVDMNAIPDDLVDFDFCWSACALEHLGSLKAGMDFIERSLGTLAPGGVAVHTTELNLTSDSETLSEGGTVLYRPRDFHELVRQLQAGGHRVMPLDLNAGNGPVDRYIDIPPYRNDPHLRLSVAGFVTTSVGLIVQKAGQTAK